MKDCLGEFVVMVIAECLIPPIVSCICDTGLKVVQNKWNKQFNSTKTESDQKEKDNIEFINKILKEEGYALQLETDGTDDSK